MCKSRILSRLLWCIAAIVLIVIICYLVYSCRVLNSAEDVSREYFSGKKYMSTDGAYYIYFSNDVQTFDLDMTAAAYSNIAITDYYENMIFFVLDDENYIIAVLDESTLFLSDARAYLYLMK